jgi:hypothetical protein
LFEYCTEGKSVAQNRDIANIITKVHKDKRKRLQQNGRYVTPRFLLPESGHKVGVHLQFDVKKLKLLAGYAELSVKFVLRNNS